MVKKNTMQQKHESTALDMHRITINQIGMIHAKYKLTNSRLCTWVHVLTQQQQPTRRNA